MIVAKNIRVDYGRKNILNNVSFHIKSGDCVGIAGLNGAGKTTLINCILGKKEISSGLLMTMGTNSISGNKSILRNIGIVSGNYSLLSDDMSIKKSFDCCAAMNNISKKNMRLILISLLIF